MEELNENRCAICSGRTVRISRTNSLSDRSGFSWEHDSTMRLLGWDRADVHLRTCLDCTHTAIWPRFDAALLYGERGGQVRKEVLAEYGQPPIVPVRGTGVLDVEQDFAVASNDLHRFRRVCSFISKNLAWKFDGLECIRILDWGGGDGYVSTVYARVLEAVTMVEARSFVYDYTEWHNVGSSYVGLKDLEKMEGFHILILSGILEHTHDPVGTLKQAASFLHPGGVVICEVPDERYNLLLGMTGKRFGLHYHVCHFNRRSLFRTMREAGFGNIHTRLEADSSYRGKPMRFFLGVGSMGQENVCNGPGRFGQVAGLGLYGTVGLTKSLGKRVVKGLRKSLIRGDEKS